MVQGVLVISNMYPGKENVSFGSFIRVHVDAFKLYTDVEQFVVANTDQRKGKVRLIWKYGSLLIRSIWASISKRFDVIHAHYAFPTGFIGLLCHWLTRKPLVITVHGSDINNLARKNRVLFKITSFVLRRAAAVIAVSRDMRDKLVSDFGLDEDGVHIINMGVNTEVFKPLNQHEIREKLGIAPNKRMILFVGNIIPIKGVLYLIEAMKGVEVPDVQCLVIGAGVDKEYMNELRAIADSAGVDVRFMGPVPYEEIALWMNAADIFVLPSLEESFGLAALEALACGTPTIATSVGGLREFVRDSETGYSVPPRDPAAIAEKINHILDPDNREEVEAIRERGLAVADSFSTEKQVRRILEVYRKVS